MVSGHEPIVVVPGPSTPVQETCAYRGATKTAKTRKRFIFCSPPDKRPSLQKSEARPEVTKLGHGSARATRPSVPGIREPNPAHRGQYSNEEPASNDISSTKLSCRNTDSCARCVGYHHDGLA